MKILYVDCETTGLNPKINSAFQISGIIEIDNQIKEEFDFKVKPTEDVSFFDPEALKVHGVGVDELLSYPPIEEVAPKLVSLFNNYIDCYNKFDKFVIVGHGVQFDIDFLLKFWDDYEWENKSYLFSYINSKRIINTLDISRFLGFQGYFPSDMDFKLETLCEFFNIELTNSHNAVDDIKATRELFKIYEDGVLFDN
jgi:DNA polymerase III epsilon subunit-like protein